MALRKTKEMSAPNATGNAGASTLAARLGVPAPDAKVRNWHVAPWVDTLAYAFSWLPFLAIVAFLGDSQRHDYIYGYLIVLAFTDVHRHYGFPYVYMDRQIFGTFPLRFTLFPLAMLALFVVSPILARADVFIPLEALAAMVSAVVLLIQVMRLDRDPETRPKQRDWLRALVVAVVAGSIGFGLASSLELNASWAWWAAIVSASFMLRAGWVLPVIALATGLIPYALGDVVSSVRPRPLLNFAAVFAGIWNIWHVYMQKYGILRMYSAKAGAEERVPGWVDRLLIFAWMPLYLFYLGTTYRTEVNRLFSRGRDILAPLFDAVEVGAQYGMLPSIGLVVGSVAVFLYWENRSHGLKNAPRLVMATGTTLLAASFLVVHPLKAYLAYALSHAVEYMVFVWAFQRRRYREPLQHKPFIQRFLHRPILVYVVSALALGLVFTYMKYYGRWIWPEADMPAIFDVTTYELIGFWTVYQSMVHFYFDGFLWKMRSPTIRATVGA